MGHAQTTHLAEPEQVDPQRPSPGSRLRSLRSCVVRSLGVLRHGCLRAPGLQVRVQPAMAFPTDGHDQMGLGLPHHRSDGRVRGLREGAVRPLDNLRWGCLGVSCLSVLLLGTTSVPTGQGDPPLEGQTTTSAGPAFLTPLTRRRDAGVSSRTPTVSAFPVFPETPCGNKGNAPFPFPVSTRGVRGETHTHTPVRNAGWFGVPHHPCSETLPLVG